MLELYGFFYMELKWFMKICELDLATLQRIENSELRKFLNAPPYACIAAIRGEIGIGTKMARIAVIAITLGKNKR